MTWATKPSAANAQAPYYPEKAQSWAPMIVYPGAKVLQVSMTLRYDPICGAEGPSETAGQAITSSAEIVYLSTKGQHSKPISRAFYLRMAASEVMSDATHSDQFSRIGRDDFVLYEEDDHDTIRALPRRDRKRSPSDSGVHFDGRFEGLPVNTTGPSEMTFAVAETAVSCILSSSSKIPKLSLPSANEDVGRDLGTAINQHLIEAYQMILLTSATLKALKIEITELRNTLSCFKEDTRKYFDFHENGPSARLAFGEIGTESSDGDDDCSPQAVQKDRAVRKVAIDGALWLAQEHHSGKERAHFEFHG